MTAVEILKASLPRALRERLRAFRILTQPGKFFYKGQHERRFGGHSASAISFTNALT